MHISFNDYYNNYYYYQFANVEWKVREVKQLAQGHKDTAEAQTTACLLPKATPQSTLQQYLLSTY